MKKIDSVVLKETKYIAFVSGILSLIMQAIFLVLAKWDYTVLFGNLLGLVAAVLNFFLLGLTVQNAVSKEEKEAKGVLKLSQAYRMIMLAVMAGFGVYNPMFNNWAVIIPLLFPRIAIGLSPYLRKETDERED